MRKHRLEISLISIFFLIFIMLIWTTLSDISRIFPIALVIFFAGLLLSSIVPSKSHAGTTQQEEYAPKFFAKVLLSSIIGIGIICYAAFLLNKESFSKTLDFSSAKINSLTDESIKFIKSLDTKVEILCVPDPSPLDKYCEINSHIIRLYTSQSDNIVYAGTLNLNDPNTIQEFQPTGFSQLILRTENNKKVIEGNINESRLTNALINLIKVKKKVYFLTGSGEPSINGGQDLRNYSDIVGNLESKAYEVKEWSLKQGDFPAEAKVVVVGDNTMTYGPEVSSILTKFKDRGGRIVLIVNPYHEQGLQDFYNSLHIKLEDKLLTLNKNTPLGKQIADQNPWPPPIMISNFNPSSSITAPIAKAFDTNAIMPVDGGRPIQILDDKSGNTKATILMSAYSAAPVTLTEAQRNKIDISKPFQITPDKNFDSNKAWPIAVDLEIKETKESKASEIVIFGFSIVDPQKNARIRENLIPLSVAHLYQDEEMVSISAKNLAPKQFNLSKNPGAWVPIFAFILPLFTALIGFFIWMRRRAG